MYVSPYLAGSTTALHHHGAGVQSRPNTKGGHRSKGANGLQSVDEAGRSRDEASDSPSRSPSRPKSRENVGGAHQTPGTAAPPSIEMQLKRRLETVEIDLAAYQDRNLEGGHSGHPWAADLLSDPNARLEREGVESERHMLRSSPKNAKKKSGAAKKEKPQGRAVVVKVRNSPVPEELVTEQGPSQSPTARSP
ncbi:unnamed protein product [Amoebophrya sp. A25]|nr:unnamed protein product [Amoebophrya sp. A25]|eukprot:GSA25T00003404001.1